MTIVVKKKRIKRSFSLVVNGELFSYLYICFNLGILYISIFILFLVKGNNVFHTIVNQGVS